jgi:hypothetical protein
MEKGWRQQLRRGENGLFPQYLSLQGAGEKNGWLRKTQFFPPNQPN